MVSYRLRHPLAVLSFTAAYVSESGAQPTVSFPSETLVQIVKSGLQPNDRAS